MSNIVQFTSASNFIAASAPSYAAVPIKYFLAAYCPALDPYVTAPEDIPDLETIFPTSAVNIPEGVEVLYNLDALSSFYQLSNDKALYYTVGQSGTVSISGSNFNDVAKVNLLSGHPLSTIVSGTSFVYENGVWTVGAPNVIAGTNSVPSGYTNSRDKFYSDVSFVPITSGAEVRGLYKMKMGKSVGTFKYNLLIPYVTRFIDSTTEDTSIEPVMFAVMKLNYPIIKTNIDGDGNFSNTEHDLSIGFSSAISGAQNHFFLDGGYWLYNGLTNSLSWDGDVVINTSAVPGSWVPDAKLTTINTNPNKAIYKATFNNDVTLRYFYTSASTRAIDDTVYSKDRVTIIKRSGGDSSPVSTIKENLEGDSKFASISLFTDANVLRGGENNNFANYLTFGSSGNSIEIISGGLNSKVIIGATSGHNQLLSTKYGSSADDALLTVHGDVKIDDWLTVHGQLNANSALFQAASILDGFVISAQNGVFYTSLGTPSLAADRASIDELQVLTSASINNAKFTGSAAFTGSLSVGTLSVANMTGTTIFSTLNGGGIDTSYLNVSYYATMGDAMINLLTVNEVNATDVNVSNSITSPNANFTTLVASNLTSLTVGNGTTMSKIVTGRTAISAASTLSILNSNVTADSIILVTYDGSDSSTPIRVSGHNVGVSFNVSLGDAVTGFINWIIINP